MLQHSLMPNSKGSTRPSSRIHDNKYMLAFEKLITTGSFACDVGVHDSRKVLALELGGREIGSDRLTRAV